MALKRLASLALLTLSLISFPACSDNPVTKSDRLNKTAIPVSCEELENYIAVTEELQADYNSMMELQEHTFDNTIQFFYDLYLEGNRIMGIFNFVAMTSPAEDVRNMAADQNLQLVSWFAAVATDSELHAVISEFTERKDEYQGDELSVLESVESILSNYGLKLDEEEKNILVNIIVQMEAISQQIKYLNIMGDPDGLISELFSELINYQTLFASYRGFDNYADYHISFQMPGSAANVESFLLDTISRLNVPYSDIIDRLQAIKAEQTGDQDSVIYCEDREIYLDDYIESEYGITGFNNKYFFDEVYAVDDILNTLFYIFEEYFNIEFIESSSPGALWHEDVKYYEMRDKETGAPIASFYADLYARTGKESASKIYPVIPTSMDNDGIYTRPVLALLMSLNKETDEGGPKIPLGNSLTLFHEFGHLLQKALSNAGTAFEFVEVFSNLFEEFFYEKEIGDLLLGQDKSWSDEDFINFKKAVTVYRLDWSSFSFANYLFNLSLYTDFGPEDSIDVLAFQEDIIGTYFLPLQYDIEEVISIGNQINYPASYYSYGWSLGIALDLADFLRSNGGLLNKTNTIMLRGKLYTLEKNFDKNEKIRSVLGRDWNMDAFYKYFGAE